jgi:acetyl esterase/lipase
MPQPILDVAYASQSPRQKLDLYLPDNDGQPHPVVLWLHPGGFSAGSKEVMIDLLAPPLIKRGYAVVAANYRLTDEAVFPAQIFDAKAAVRWIRANASRYRLNPEKIAAWGCSAGATLAVLLGTSSKVPELEDLSMGNSAESSAVNAVVNWYAPIDLLKIDAQLLELGYPAMHSVGKTGLFNVVGGPGPELFERCEKLNPTCYITAGAPPVYIQHGAQDDTVPLTQSLRLADSLRSVIGNEKVALNIVENADHFSGRHQSQENLAKVIDFLDKCLH